MNNSIKRRGASFVPAVSVKNVYQARVEKICTSEFTMDNPFQTYSLFTPCHCKWDGWQTTNSSDIGTIKDDSLQ